MANETFQRIIALEGGRNFRDLGGYRTQDGRHTKWGLLFRSGALCDLTPGGWDQLVARQIRTMCDLRSARERADEPFAWSDHESLSYWTHDPESSFAELGETLKSGFPTAEAARQGMIAGYRWLPFNFAPAYRQLFAYLKEDAVPLVFNCAGGKDRAGTAAALILTALGVEREIVVQDYLLTNSAFDVETTILKRQEGPLSGYPAGVTAAIAAADAAYIQAALDAVSAEEGGFEGFLAAQLDVSRDELHALRDRFLE